MTTIASRIEIEALTPDMLQEPLVWFFAEHYRHRQICQRLSEYTQTVVLDIEQTEEILNFLETDLPLHIIDEEDDLFPLLRRRCEPEDRLERTLGILSGDHAADMDVGKELASVLKMALKENQGLGTSQKAKDVIERFCSSQKRHIALENAVVLPIARHRLTDADKRALGRRLAARRGLPDPFKLAS